MFCPYYPFDVAVDVRYGPIDGSGRNATLYYVGVGPYGPKSGFAFPTIEFVLAVCLAVDILARATAASSLRRFLLDYYTLIDLAAYVSIAYYFVFVGRLEVLLWRLLSI